MNSISGSERRRSILASLAALVMFVPVNADAQPWEEFRLESTFDTWSDSVRLYGGMWFTDSATGYVWWRVPWIEIPGPEAFQARTTDAGRSWRRMETWVPTPQYCAGQFGYTRAGQVSTDGGASWHLAMDSTVAQLVASPFNAESPPRFLVALSRWSMRLSSDQGRSWIALDTLDTVICQRRIDDSTIVDVPVPTIGRSTAFGPATPDSLDQFRWVHLAGFRDSILYALSIAGNCSTGLSQYWMFRIDLGAMSCVRWQVDRRIADGLKGLEVFDSSMMFAFDRGTDKPLLRSTDGGRHWDTASRLNTGNLHVLSPGYAITNDRLSVDSGRTWQPWTTKFGSVWLFQALDSIHLFACGTSNGERRCIRSTDGGATWIASNNAAPTRSSAFVACRGVVHLAAGAGVLLRSTDHGETFENIALDERRLPPNVMSITSLVYPDSVSEPDRILGATSVILDRHRVEHRLIESLDNGVTWHLYGEPFPDAIGALRFTAPPASVGTAMSAGFLHTSTDRGATWTQRGRPAPGLVMSDANRGLAGVPGGSTGSAGFILRTNDGSSTYDTSAVLNPPNADVLGLVSFRPGVYSILAPSVWGGGQLSMHTTDHGATWKIGTSRSDVDLRGAPLLWLSPSHVFSTKNGAILYSADSGRGFALLNPEWGGDAACTDSQYVYLANWSKVAVGRWRIGGVSSVESERMPNQDWVRAYVDQTGGGRVVVEVAEPWSVPARVSIVDARGETRAGAARGELGPNGRYAIEVVDLPSGAYHVLVEHAGRRAAIPVVLVR